MLGVIREQFHERNRERIAKRIDRVSIIAYPLIIAIIAIYIAHYAAFFTGAAITTTR